MEEAEAAPVSGGGDELVDADEEDQAEGAAVDEQIFLRCGSIKVSTPAWSQLAKVPTALTCENYEALSKVHIAVAVERYPDSEFVQKLLAVRCPAVSNWEQTPGACAMVLLFLPNGETFRPDPLLTLADFIGYLKDATIRIVGGPPSPEPTAAPVLPKPADFQVIGLRIRMAYGAGTVDDPVLWYGGTVDEVRDDGSIGVACDDGTVEYYSVTEMQESLQSAGLATLDVARGGLVANDSGLLAAECFARIDTNNQHAKTKKVVGVLKGATGCQLVGEMLYQEFHLHAASLLAEVEEKQQEEGRRTRNTKADVQQQSMQDRFGLNTFRRGDLATFNKDARGVARVSSLTFPSVGAKYLVMQEVSSDLFFIGRFTEWTRKVTTVGADPNDNDHVESMGDAEAAVLAAAQIDSDALKKLTNKSKLEFAARTVSEYGPPSVEVAVKQKAKEDKKKAAEREKTDKGGGGNGKGPAPPPKPKAKPPPKPPKPPKPHADSQPINLDDTVVQTAPLPALHAAEKRNQELAAQLVALQKQIQLGQSAPAANVVPVPVVTGAAPSQATLPALSPTAALQLPHRTPQQRGANQPGLPEGWKVARDEDGNVYYSNKKRGLSQYEHPGDGDSPPLAPPSRRPRTAALNHFSFPGDHSRPGSSAASSWRTQPSIPQPVPQSPNLRMRVLREQIRSKQRELAYEQNHRVQGLLASEVGRLEVMLEHMINMESCPAERLFD